MKAARVFAVAGVLVFNLALAQGTKLKVLEQHPPAYPLAEESARHGGRVVLRVSVKEDGSIEAVEVTTGTGFAALDQAAVEAVKTWRFAPATDDQGKPIAAGASFALNFKPPTPPAREIDTKITCGQITQDVAALRAANPEASVEQIPAIGALRDMAESTAAVLPPATGAEMLAALPKLYQDVLDTCAKKPKSTFMDAYFKVTKVIK